MMIFIALRLSFSSSRFRISTRVYINNDAKPVVNTTLSELCSGQIASTGSFWQILADAVPNVSRHIVPRIIIAQTWPDPRQPSDRTAAGGSRHEEYIRCRTLHGISPGSDHDASSRILLGFPVLPHPSSWQRKELWGIWRHGVRGVKV